MSFRVRSNDANLLRKPVKISRLVSERMVIIMRAGWIRVLSVALLLAILMVSLCGCWDNDELDSLFIVVGIALDTNNDPEQADVTMQVAKTLSKEPKTGDTPAKNDSVLLMKSTKDTIMGAIKEIDLNSSRKLFLQHNQVVLLGKEFAQQGLTSHLDMFMRNQETRMEVPLVVVDGRAEDVLSAQLKEHNISSMYLFHMLSDLTQISPAYKVRLLDFVSKLLEKTTSPVVPIVSVKGEEDAKELEFSGMAVFKGNHMTGRLNNEQTDGYLWAMGGVNQGIMEVEDQSGKAVFCISEMITKQNVTLDTDQVKVKISVNADMTIKEIKGYKELNPRQMMDRLTELANAKIKETIINCFEVTRGMKADIFGFGASVYKQYPKDWNSIKENWDSIYNGIELNVETKVTLPQTGQIIKTLDMEDMNPDD